MKSRKHHRRHPLPAGMNRTKPMVAIVGRPNVGKSTIFNRLARQNLAIVEDQPGVTRDRHYADATTYGRSYVLIDTGGFDPDSDDPMKHGIADQVRLALQECDIVLFIFDGSVEPVSADREAVNLLRDHDKPVLFCANKADSQTLAHNAGAYYELGVSHIHPISALHGRGFGEMEEELAKLLPTPEVVVEEDEFEDDEWGHDSEDDIATDDEDDDGPPDNDDDNERHYDLARIAIIGRPNAGKSSLVNRLVGEQRQLVDNRPGTTVDSIDTLLEKNGSQVVLIDTAGIRRKSRVNERGVEALSVYHAIRAMERSDVVILMVDAHEGVSEQDAKIAGLAVDRGNALIIGLNKADLMTADEARAARTRTREVLSFAPWAPIVTLSAKGGRGVGRLFETMLEVIENYRKRVKTAEMNRFFEEVLGRHPPPTQKNRSVRLYYVTQAESAPPTFVVVTNHPDYVHFSYQRYVENQIRQRFGFDGTPLRIRYRLKRRRPRPT